MEKDRSERGFTLVELMVVIMIVGVLVSVSVPIFRERAEQSKWAEGIAAAGTIRIALRAYYAEDPIAAATMAGSTVDTVQGTLGFFAGDLTGRYFQAGNFTITAIDGNGNVTITVTAPAGLTGSGVLNNTGWIYTP
ncbi:MAG: pilin [Planctomycetes bacterium]|nr:pilin [Planctomycetota bacterium]